MSNVEEGKKDLVKDVNRLALLGVRFEDSKKVGFWFIKTLSNP